METKQENKTITTTSIKKIIIDEGKVTSVEFEHDNNKYTASVSPADITVNSVGQYDRQQNTMLWQTKHVCGASGFSPMLGDYCTACNTKGGFIKNYSEARNYQPKEIVVAIAHINCECNRLEQLLKEHEFK